MARPNGSRESDIIMSRPKTLGRTTDRLSPAPDGAFFIETLGKRLYVRLGRRLQKDVARSGARAISVRASAYLGDASLYLAFLDELGHIGPFLSRQHRRFNQSPVFGLGGFIIPHAAARGFATWFFQQKNQLLAPEIKLSKQHPATWEKKGSDLVTTRNVKKYPNIPRVLNRIINKIYRSNGRLFYCAREKYQRPQASKPSGLYTTVMAHSIRQIDRLCEDQAEFFLVILDQHESRINLLAAAAKTMFGAEPARRLIEPPLEAESHLYQTLQAADWLAALIGKVLAYRVRPQDYPDWAWAPRLFGERIDRNVTHSSLWRPGAAFAPPQSSNS